MFRSAFTSSSKKDQELPPLPLSDEFKYEKGCCALEYWEPVRLIGEGSISDIHLVQRRSKRIHVRYKKKRDIMKFAKQKSGQDVTQDNTDLYVLKSIMKDHVDNDDVLDEMRSEIHTMSKLEHPNIAKLYEAYERRRHIYLVLEYCSGGDLTGRHFSDQDCAPLVRKILSAVAYMHSKGVVHRDLKLENIMFDGSGEIKIIDFGLATKYLGNEWRLMSEKVGTLYSMAPQVLQGVYDSKCDIWSIGVVTYMLLSGVNPFWGPPRSMSWPERRKIMIDRILRCKYQRMTGSIWEKVSEEAKAFTKCLLQMDPKKRPTAQAALQADWIREAHTPDPQVYQVNDFQRRNVLLVKRKAAETLGKSLSEAQLEEFNKEMHKADVNGSGHITLLQIQRLLKSKMNLKSEMIASIFTGNKGVDLSTEIDYHDFYVEVLTSRGRSITEKVAEMLDELDYKGTRKVPKEDVMYLLELTAGRDKTMELWSEVHVSQSEQVSTVEVLEALDRILTTNLRESLRGQKADKETELADQTNIVIPGGHNEPGQKVKYVYNHETESFNEA